MPPDTFPAGLKCTQGAFAAEAPPRTTLDWESWICGPLCGGRNDCELLQDAQLSQRDRAAGCVGLYQKRKTATDGRQHCTDIIDLFSTTMT